MKTQQWIITNYPDSYAAQAYVAAPPKNWQTARRCSPARTGITLYIYNPPAGYAWQIVALVGEEIAGGTEIPDVPSSLSRSIILLHGPLLHRAPEAALI